MDRHIQIIRAANRILRHESFSQLFKKDTIESARELRAQGLGPSISVLSEEIYAEASRQYSIIKDRRLFSPVSLFPSLDERLERWRKDTFLGFVDFRTSLSGKHEFIVEFTDDPSKVSAEGYSLDGERYPGRYGFKRNSFLSFVIPYNWITRVKNRDLSVVDGLLTLDAQPLLVNDREFEAFSAVWVGQGRGFTLNVSRGVIVRHKATGYTYHGNSIKHGKAAIRRKLNYSVNLVKRTRRIEKWLNNVSLDYGSVPVSFDDAKETGACEYGIRSWCFSVGIDPDDNFAFLKDVIDGYFKLPQQEALAVIKHMVNKTEGLVQTKGA